MLLVPYPILRFRRQSIGGHPEMMTGGASYDKVNNGTIRARQHKAISDLGRDSAFRAGYERKHRFASQRAPTANSR
jgi:hypothetical protein